MYEFSIFEGGESYTPAKLIVQLEQVETAALGLDGRDPREPSLWITKIKIQNCFA